MATDNTYVNALVGAAVAVVFSFIPFSPLAGGAVAGYLEGRDGGRIGFITGVFTSLPLFLVLLVGGTAVAAFLGFGIPKAGGVILAAIIVVLFLLVYTVALSVVGGVVGVYLAEEFRGV